MATVEQEIAPLVQGDKLTREEFLRRWEAMPQVRKAELIGGIVYMPSPQTADHGDMDVDVGYWLRTYTRKTPGCQPSHNATTFMLEDAPQPDLHLRILPEYGGNTRMHHRFVTGAPELVSEVSLSSTSYDLHQKLELYQEAGVVEYIAILLREQEIRWHRLRGSAYQLLPQSTEGIICSKVFPGLWLDVQAMLRRDLEQVLATLQQGLDSPAHAKFVTQLARKRSAR